MARQPNRRRYTEMQGRTGRGGSPGMGEHVGDPRRYVTEPGTKEDTDLLKGIFRGGKQKSTPSRRPRLDPVEDIREYGMKTIRTIPVGAAAVSISPRLITNVKSLRIDSDLEFRKDIMIANMSTAIIWVNTRPMVGQNDGMPLGPISAAAKYDGGSISIDATDDVDWFAIASAGTSNQIIVIESSR